MDNLIVHSILPALKYDSTHPLLFNSTFFLFFFLLLVTFYPWVANRIKTRTWYLLLFSLYFYYKTSGVFVLLLVATALVNWLLGSLIYRSNSKKWRVLFFLGSAVWNLGTLGYYKYTNFIFTTINQIAGGSLPLVDVFLPVGISFFTFQTWSYTMDIYLRKLKPVDSFKDFVFFVAFFPQLVAGPIVRASWFLPQIRKQISLDNETIGKAMLLIMSGLVKKAVLADYLSINFVDRVFAEPTLFTGLENLLGVYAYAIQIYCDFSGYSDMAIGLAALLGFDLPINFRTPYQAKSITEFWHRWHISLSTWLRDYLYIPLGGNRKGKVRQYLNLMATMLLGGLWHGASWNFVFWGGLHGLGLMLDKWWLNLKLAKSRLMQAVGVVVTFHFVCLGWIFFRSPDFHTAGVMLSRIFFQFNGLLILEWLKGYKVVALLICAGFLFHWIPDNWDSRLQRWMKAVPIPVQSLLLALVIWLVYQAKSADIQPFIYFQF